MTHSVSRIALALSLTVNVVAVVLHEPASGLHAAQIHLLPIATYSRGVYSDAVGELPAIQHGSPTLTAIRHFALVSRGSKIGVFDVNTLERMSPHDCHLAIIGTIGPPNPPASAMWFRDSESLALSIYHPVAKSIAEPGLPEEMPRYTNDLLAAARTVLERPMGDGLQMTPSHPLKITSLKVMDVYHDDRAEVWAKVKSDRAYAIVWLSYANGKPRVLRVHADILAGGSASTPTFVGTADIDGDGVDEVVIRDQADTADSYEIDTLTANSVRRVFQSRYYGC